MKIKFQQGFIILKLLFSYKILFLFFFFLIISFSCKKDQEIPTSNYVKGDINGYCQKGPFVNGSSITVYELDSAFSQTGKNYNTQIQDNSGSFALSNISLMTNYAELKADGFYFNEITNSSSLASISLYALSDLFNKSTVNVNLLTNLEFSRVKYLLSNGLDFVEAKTQAQQEVLNIFSIHKDSVAESELLDISKDGDDNAILLAVSVILQGFRTEAEMTQLMGDISTDIRTDGILNSSTLGSDLINDAKLVDLSKTRSNLESKYAALGITATIPDFEKYINIFRDSTNYLFTKNIIYPTVINSLTNLISDSVYTAQAQTLEYTCGAYLPKGTTLKVICRPSSGYQSCLGVNIENNNGWNSIITSIPNEITMTAVGNDQLIYVPWSFSCQSSTDFFVYENNSAIPTKKITIISN